MFAGIIASVLSLIWSDSIWSLFLMEFISKCASLSGFLVRNDFRNLLHCVKRFIRITYVRLFNCIIYILSRKRKCKVYLFIWKCLKNNWAANVWQQIPFNPTRNFTAGLVWNASFKLYNHIRMTSLYNFFIKTLRKFAALLLLQSFTIINFLLHSITFGGLYFAAPICFKYAWNRSFDI